MSGALTFIITCRLQQELERCSGIAYQGSWAAALAERLTPVVEELMMSQLPHNADVDFTNNDEVRLNCTNCGTRVGAWEVPVPLDVLNTAWRRHEGAAL